MKKNVERRICMNVMDAISKRRSIRKFKPDPLPDEIIQKILEAGRKAPSGHNRQPWQFVVVKGEKRTEMIQAMKRGIAASKALLGNVGSAEYSLKVMAEAPVTIFVLNPYRKPIVPAEWNQWMIDTVDIQSCGAAIQNMLLTATELGIGSLWICDIFFAYDELCKWLNKECQMIAAISFGYADESPAMRPRKRFDEIVEWK